MSLRISRPITFINLLVMVGVLYEVFITYRGAEISESSNYLWMACFSFCVAWWIESDRKTRAISAPFEYQAFVFFLWPIAAPYYLFQTRRWRGFFQGIGLFCYSCLPGIAAFITYWLINEAP